MALPSLRFPSTVVSAPSVTSPTAVLGESKEQPAVVVGAIRPRTTVEFQFDQQPDPSWIHALREQWPRSDTQSFPYLLWEPGDPWIPGERWVIYEMMHPRVLEESPQGDVLLDEFRGPHPRSEGHLCWAGSWRHTSFRWPRQFQCLCRHKMDAWKGGPCQLVSLTQWKLFRETGLCGFPLWVIEGTKGGHPFQYDEWQQQRLAIYQLPTEPPVLGSLPYAPFDGRVIKALRRANRLEQLGLTLDEYRRTMGSSASYQEHRERLAKDLRAEWVKFLAEQMEDDVNGLFLRAAREGEIDDHAPRTDIDYERLDDLATEHYVETGRILTAQEMDTPLVVPSAGITAAF